MSLRRKILYGFTLALMAVLLVLPATGWLLRLQWTAALPAGSAARFMNALMWGDVARQKALLQPVTKAAPADTALQLAAALHSAGDAQKQQLDLLRERHPEDALVLAVWLRVNAEDLLSTRDRETRVLSAKKKGNTAATDTPRAMEPGRVAAVIAVAQQGECCDPENAFFPAMRAAGLFAAKRDDEAVAAWILAGTRSRWNDYSGEEMAARERLLQSLNGGHESGFVARLVCETTIDLAHLKTLRAAARLSTVAAMHAEMAGDTRCGIAIRQATLRIGNVMREQGREAAVNLTGQALVHVAALRPGGAAALAVNKLRDPDSMAAMHQREAMYTAYLAGAGYEEEAARYHAEIAAGDPLRAIARAGLKTTYSGPAKKTEWLFLWEGVASILIVAILTTVFFGLLAAATYALFPRLRAGMPISWKWMKAHPRALGIGLLLSGGAVGLLAVFGTVGIHLFDISVIAQALLGNTGGESLPASFLRLQVLPLLVGFLTASLLPAFCFSSGRRMKLPASLSVVRGTRALAGPVACGFLLLYAVCLCGMAPAENAAVAEMKRITAIGEWQTFAEMPENAPAPSQGK